MCIRDRSEDEQKAIFLAAADYGKQVDEALSTIANECRCGILNTAALEMCIRDSSTPLDPESPADVEEAIRIKESTHATLRSAHMPGWDWGPESLLNYVADFFDHERVLGQPEERHIEYDSSRSLRSQLSNPEIASAVADSFIKYRTEGGAETAIQ